MWPADFADDADWAFRDQRTAGSTDLFDYWLRHGSASPIGIEIPRACLSECVGARVLFEQRSFHPREGVASAVQRSSSGCEVSCRLCLFWRRTGRAQGAGSVVGPGRFPSHQLSGRESNQPWVAPEFRRFLPPVPPICPVNGCHRSICGICEICGPPVIGDRRSPRDRDQEDSCAFARAGTPAR